MEEIQKTYKVYEFEELDEDTQEKVIEDFRERIYTDPFLLQGFKERVEEELREMGFKGVSLRYDLSRCQGSGFSFVCDDIDLGKVLKEFDEYERFKRILENDNIDVWGDIKTGHLSNHYQHKNTVDVHIEMDYDEEEMTEEEVKEIVSLGDELEGCIRHIKNKLCDRYERKGYDEIEYRTSEDYVKKEIEERDLRFLDDGTIFDE